MLTKDTKDRIDRARQILVGQLPLPSDQIELITIALIYKFMDDMDEQSRDLGGQASFFVGKLRDYSWREIVANKLDAKERVDRFVKGVEQLSDPKDNPIPELFQSIFRNTFVKFRDGRTLKLFLDELNGFTYDHSEELGNAFEYLLETMGTQADNGQFRTPRHIIDFVVAAVAPQLGQSILDPACGTAGFLISAFRHIIAAHTSEPEKGRARRPGDRLTAEQRQQLTRDVVGYDITPQMARLSRVNMYLHQFASPVIHEYDTITNTARWDEKFDVILANPPFMSPHGGNQTHDKFRIAASRTEVLFADYILEHLLPDGRAGFIVPEGIIFQNNGDYVALRKWLIEEGGLWAVASLPAGVFQPYSGVKTSVLFIDRALARRRSDVLLLKIENDGFGLNTNRNPIAGNDLPAALQLVEAARGEDYREALAKLASPVQHRLVSRADFARLDAYRANSAAWSFVRKFHARAAKLDPGNARAVTRLRADFSAATGLAHLPDDEAELKTEFENRIKSAAIAYGDDPKAPTTLTSGLRECLDGQREYALTLETHSAGFEHSTSFQMTTLGEVTTQIRNGYNVEQTEVRNGTAVSRIETIADATVNLERVKYTSDAVSEEMLLRDGDILFSHINSEAHIGKTAIFSERLHGRMAHGINLLRFRPNREIIEPQFLLRILRSERVRSFVRANCKRSVNQASINIGFLRTLPVPLPPLEEQQAMVAEIESYQRVVDGCAAVLAGYRANFTLSPGWPKIELGEICSIKSGGTPDRTNPAYWDGAIPWVTTTLIDNGVILRTNEFITPEGLKNSPAWIVPKGTVLMAMYGQGVTRGRVAVLGLDAAVNQACAVFQIKNDSLLSDYLFAILQTRYEDLRRISEARGGNQSNLSGQLLKEYVIPLPPIETQRAIVAELTREQSTLAGVAELKAKHEARIRARLAAVWGEAPAAAPAPALSPAEAAA